MPTETAGQISVRGRMGNLQVVSDAQDTTVPVVPAAATKAEVHSHSPDQNILYSLTGGANTWITLPPSSRFHATGPYRFMLNGAVNLYFRKAYNPRGDKSIHDGVTGALFPDARMAMADDKIAKVLVTFTI